LPSPLILSQFQFRLAGICLKIKMESDGSSAPA